MKNRIVDREIVLVRYYPNYKTTLEWYQDAELCKQVDNRDSVYDLALLKDMYSYLNRHGELFYIKYKNRLCGDVCLQPDGQVNIVIAKPFQNKHIGRRVIGAIIQLAKENSIEELYAEIYPFNSQSKKMFESVGFRQVDAEKYTLVLSDRE
jgi:cytidine deaminase